MGGARLVDIARGEKVEGELDILITRRDTERRRTEGERPAEQMWRESSRRYNERRRQQMWWERLRYRVRMIEAHTATLHAIIAAHEEEAARCRHALGLEENGHEERRV
jgi:hypothetical protein